ncbi:FtsK/SpoIIIE domain-containing protein [Isobaculum melis]|uniref:FtsK/SpoIIIE family protein n=1 Tax=Isobaculum melis TaxID=142588 RepID=A0A1H9TPA0_9LACT|nr:FtsK/SpoIIIE domain-containing protein [Isobaculum melis]SER99006.1 FtsK/SpoIIIE family protein [Isobaculum melis]
MKLQFIDWKFKGNRVRSNYRNILKDIFSTIFAIPTLIYILAFIYTNFETLRQFTNSNLKDGLFYFGKHMLIAVAIGLFTCSVAFILMYRFWAYIHHIQKLCRMMYSSKYYLVNDREDPNMMASSEKRMVRNLQYFPKLYFWRTREYVNITIQLDGSKFNQDYRELADRFEQMFALSLVETEERNGFYTYKMLPNASKYRLHISEIIPNGYRIRLSKHFVWDISKLPHALITGGTGGGKSRFMIALIKGFIEMRADVRVIDPKLSALSDLSRIMPNVAYTTDGILELVEKTVKEMNDRQLEMKTKENYISGNDFTHYNMQPIILVIDEYVAFMDGLPKKQKDIFASNVLQITLKGREAGVFIVLATQRPDTTSLAGSVRDNLGLRVTLGEMKPDGYRMVFGTTEQKLRNKKGLGRGYIYQNGDSLIREFFAPLVPDSYNMMNEFARMLDVEPCAFSAQAVKASMSANTEREPSGELEVKQVIHGRKNE